MKLDGLILGLGAVLVLPPVTRGENEIGRLTSVGNAFMRRHYEYDVLGRVNSEVHVLDGTPYAYRYGYGYALSEEPSRGPGRVRTDMTFPDGEKVCYGYDLRSALKGITARCEGAPQEVLSSVSYDALGRAVQIGFGNGAMTNSCYNPADRRLDRRRTSFTPETCGSLSGTPVQDHAYSYDPVGNVKTVQDLVAGVPASFSAAYEYDSLDRLASRGSGGSTLHYTYDASGNLVGKEVAAAGARNQAYGGTDRGPHALADARQVTYAYDLNGNLVSATDGTSIAWNVENMATTVTKGGATLTKSFLGDSVWKKVEGAGTTHYLPSLRIESGAHRKFYESWAERSTEDGQLRFYHPDHLGSSTAMTDLARTVAHRSAFMPYGEDIGQAGGSFSPKLRFNFKEKEATGFYDYGARLYDPASGRWISPDKLLVDGLNRYAYVRNNPLRYVDPTGHAGQDPATRMFVPVSVEELALDPFGYRTGDPMDRLDLLRPMRVPMSRQHQDMLEGGIKLSMRAVGLFIPPVNWIVDDMEGRPPSDTEMALDSALALAPLVGKIPGARQAAQVGAGWTLATLRAASAKMGLGLAGVGSLRALANEGLLRLVEFADPVWNLGRNTRVIEWVARLQVPMQIARRQGDITLTEILTLIHNRNYYIQYDKAKNIATLMPGRGKGPMVVVK